MSKFGYIQKEKFISRISEKPKPTQSMSKKNSNKDMLWQKEKKEHKNLISLEGREAETENNLSRHREGNIIVVKNGLY